MLKFLFIIFHAPVSLRCLIFYKTMLYSLDSNSVSNASTKRPITRAVQALFEACVFHVLIRGLTTIPRCASMQQRELPSNSGDVRTSGDEKSTLRTFRQCPHPRSRDVKKKDREPFNGATGWMKVCYCWLQIRGTRKAAGLEVQANNVERKIWQQRFLSIHTSQGIHLFH